MIVAGSNRKRPNDIMADAAGRSRRSLGFTCRVIDNVTEDILFVLQGSQQISMQRAYLNRKKVRIITLLFSGINRSNRRRRALHSIVAFLATHIRCVKTRRKEYVAGHGWQYASRHSKRLIQSRIWRMVLLTTQSSHSIRTMADGHQWDWRRWLLQETMGSTPQQPFRCDLKHSHRKLRKQHSKAAILIQYAIYIPSHIHVKLLII